MLACQTRVMSVRVVVMWSAESGSDLLAVLPQRDEPLHAGSENELRRQVEDLVTERYGPDGFEVTYRRVPASSLGA